MRGALLLLVALGAVGVLVRVIQPARDVEAPIFRTSVVERREVIQTVEATGRLRPRDLAVVMAPVSGRLVSIEVAVRDVVEAGQRLARIEAANLSHDVRRARAAVSAARGGVVEAQATERDAKRGYERAKVLAERGQMSETARDSAATAASRAEAALSVARAKLTEALEVLSAADYAESQLEVRAPRAGVVLEVPSQLGAAVSPAGPVLFTVSAPLDVLRLDASVGEADIGALRVGQAARFEVQAFPKETFEARVEAIGVMAAPGQGVPTYPVTLTVANSEGRLLPGMSAAVRFEVARVPNALAVKDAALRFQPSDASRAPPRSRVFKTEADGALQAIEVTVGISDGVWVEVRPVEARLLEAGDHVAVGYNAGEARGGPGLKIGG
ncbi:MAG: efflux RND transporter periplasmic adaptor subunit [Deltaproteobacteria bacterium]|nr:efflux RND transporter periplasmic adaptor subunit [Deltaproteobacteria bacterium]